MSQQETTSAQQRYQEKIALLQEKQQKHGLTNADLQTLIGLQSDVQSLTKVVQRELWEQRIGDIARGMHVSVEVGSDETALLRDIIEQVLNGVRVEYPDGLQEVSNEDVIQRISLREPE